MKTTETRTTSVENRKKLKAAIEDLRTIEDPIERVVMHDGGVKVYTFTSFNHWANDRGPGGCKVGLTGLRELGIVVPFLPFFSQPEERPATPEEAKRCDFGPLTWGPEKFGWQSRRAA